MSMKCSFLDNRVNIASEEIGVFHKEHNERIKKRHNLTGNKNKYSQCKKII